MFLENKSTGLHFAADNISLSSLKFSGGRRNFCSLRRGRRFGRSRLSKVDKFGANRKRVGDFLLVRNSNFGPILHSFGAKTRFMCSWPYPYSTLILGVFPLHKIAHVGHQRAHEPYAIRPWNYFRRIPNCVIMIPDRHRRTDRRTDGQTTYCRITALCASIAR